MAKKKKTVKEMLMDEIAVEERFQKEFLTKKQQKSFDQVEKYVSKNWKDLEENLRKKKAERWVEDDGKFSTKSEKDRYEEAKLETMISQIALSSKWSSWWEKSKEAKILYVIYLVILLAIVIFCAKHYLVR